jgi:hypothetical protein
MEPVEPSAVFCVLLDKLLEVARIAEARSELLRRGCPEG